MQYQNFVSSVLPLSIFSSVKVHCLSVKYNVLPFLWCALMLKLSLLPLSFVLNLVFVAPLLLRHPGVLKFGCLAG